MAGGYEIFSTQTTYPNKSLPDAGKDCPVTKTRQQAANGPGRNFMTERLRIKCPYSAGDNHRVLMIVYYDESEQPIDQIKIKQKVTNIEAVEIFSEILDEKKGDKPEAKAALFLTTMASESQMSFRKKDAS